METGDATHRPSSDAAHPSEAKSDACSRRAQFSCDQSTVYADTSCPMPPPPTLPSVRSWSSRQDSGAARYYPLHPLSTPYPQSSHLQALLLARLLE